MRNKLQIEPLNAKMHVFSILKTIRTPDQGWIRSIRTSIGMSLEQLAKRLSISKQSVQKTEKREMAGNISLNTIHDVAVAMDMKLVYAFVPNEDSLDIMIDK